MPTPVCRLPVAMCSGALRDAASAGCQLLDRAAVLGGASCRAAWACIQSEADWAALHGAPSACAVGDALSLVAELHGAVARASQCAAIAAVVRTAQQVGASLLPGARIS